MAYTATYGANEMSEVVIDNIVGIGSALFAFVSLVALILLYRYVRGKKVV